MKNQLQAMRTSAQPRPSLVDAATDLTFGVANGFSSVRRMYTNMTMVIAVLSAALAFTLAVMLRDYLPDLKGESRFAQADAPLVTPASNPPPAKSRRPTDKRARVRLPGDGLQATGQ